MIARRLAFLLLLGPAQILPAAGLACAQEKEAAARTTPPHGMEARPAPETGSMPGRNSPAPTGRLGTEPAGKGKLGTPPPENSKDRPPRPQ